VGVPLLQDDLLRISWETVRRRMRAAEMVWRRPRPALASTDLAHADKVGRIGRVPGRAPEPGVVVHHLPVYAPEANPSNGCGGACTRPSPATTGVPRRAT